MIAKRARSLPLSVIGDPTGVCSVDRSYAEGLCCGWGCFRRNELNKMIPNKDGAIIETLMLYRVPACSTQTFRTHRLIPYTYSLYVLYDTEHSGAIPSR